MPPSQISAHAVVETRDIAADARVAEFAVIRADVKIGTGVVIHPHVVIESGVEIGDGVEIFPGAYIGKEPKGAGALARQPQFDRRVVIGANSSVGPHAVVYYDVEIGEQCLVGDGASIREQCRIGSSTIIGRYVTVNYNVRIGDRVKIMDHTWLAGNMRIEDDVFISGGVLSANDNAIGKQRDYRENEIVGPTILRGAAVGVGAILLPHITIGERSIVAAGAVVTKDTQAESLVAGVPAKARTSTP